MQCSVSNICRLAWHCVDCTLATLLRHLISASAWSTRRDDNSSAAVMPAKTSGVAFITKRGMHDSCMPWVVMYTTRVTAAPSSHGNKFTRPERLSRMEGLKHWMEGLKHQKPHCQQRDAAIPAGPLTKSVVMPPRLMDALTGVTLDRATVPVAAPVLMYTCRNAPVRRLPSTLHNMAQEQTAAHYQGRPS